MVEKMIGNVKTRQRKMLVLTLRSWTTVVGEMEWIINRSVNAITQFTPNVLAFGKTRDGVVVTPQTWTKWKDLVVKQVHMAVNARGRRHRQLGVALK